MADRSGGRLKKNDTVVTVSISGSAVSKTVSGIPASITTEEIRGKDQFGNEKFPFTGD